MCDPRPHRFGRRLDADAPPRLALLVAAVPVALLAAVVMMMLGHVTGGLALFGGSILAAAIAVTLAGMSGMRHLRKLLSGRSFRVVPLDGSQYTDVAEPKDSDFTNVLQLTACSNGEGQVSELR